MPSVTRLGDHNTGHGCCFVSVPLVTASKDVFINNKGCGRKTDTYKTHGGCDNHGADTDHIASGSKTVFVNGLPIARLGDRVDNGGSVAQGSPNVYAGG